MRPLHARASGHRGNGVTLEQAWCPLHGGFGDLDHG